ncbi:hypothetical protein [uncultured Winogradskyella sp.]|uniref:hypothetical protein n=1 Tax=uncultured Winogradskyella sp. TaxID=395353 RepID=UPI003518D70D
MTLKNSIQDFIFKELKHGLLFKRRLNKIRSYYELSASEREYLESTILVKHIKNAYSKSIFYKDLYDLHGVNLNQIQTKDDLDKLPIIQKEHIKDRVNDLYIGSRFKHTSYTSGTSGTPLKVYYDLNCVLNEASYNEIFRNNAGHHYGQRVVSLRGALDGSKMDYYDKYSNILYLSSYHLKNDNAKWYYQKLLDFKPNCILAYPSSLESLAYLFRENNFEITVPLAFTSSETLYPHQQNMIETVLNTKVYDRYGNAERTISLVQANHRDIYEFPALYSVNEFLSEDEIATTNIINPNFPLIRYLVNDVLCFNENQEVVRIAGRIDDVVLTPDGLRIGSAAMSLAFKLSSNLLMAQIVQNDLNKIYVNIVVNKEFNATDEQLLKSKIRQKVGNEIIIEIAKVETNEIQKTLKGKYKLIINNLV